MKRLYWLLMGIVFISGGCRAPLAPASSTPPSVADTPYQPAPSEINLPSSTPRPISTPLPTLTRGPTRTSLVTDTWTPSPTPRFSLTPQSTTTAVVSSTVTARSLYEQSIVLCEAAFSITATVTVTPQLPAFPLIQRAYLSNVWELQGELEWISARTAEEVRTIACIRENRRADALYSDGNIGYTLSWEVRLIRWPDGALAAQATFWGSGPSLQKLVSGPAYGAPPLRRFEEWLLCDLPLDSRAFCGSGGPLAFSPDSQFLAAGNDLWTLASGQRIRLATAAAAALAFSPNGRVVAVAEADRPLIGLYDAVTGQALRQLQGHSGAVLGLAFAPDGRELVSGSQDGTVLVWEVESGQVLRTLGTDLGWVHAVAYSPNGQWVAAGLWSQPGWAYVWEATTREQRYKLKTSDVFVNALAFSPDGALLATASLDGLVKLWELSSGRLVGILEGHTESVSSLSFSADGKTLASGSDDRTVIVWDVASGQALYTLEGFLAAVEGVAFSPDGKWLAASDWSLIKWWALPLEP